MPDEKPDPSRPSVPRLFSKAALARLTKPVKPAPDELVPDENERQPRTLADAERENREEEEARTDAHYDEIARERIANMTPAEKQAEVDGIRESLLGNNTQSHPEPDPEPVYQESLYGPPPPPIEKKWWHVGPLKPKPSPAYPPPVWKTYTTPDGKTVRMMHVSTVPYPTTEPPSPKPKQNSLPSLPRLPESDLSRSVYALALAILLSALVVSCGDRYALNTVSSSRAFQVDRWTGKTWDIRPDRKTLIEEND